MVKIYKQPFAHDGDAIAIPDASQPDGKMSSADGWTPDYQLPKTDPSYKPVGRQEMNGVFKEVTEALGQVQVQGAASWSVDGAPYPINAQVYHNGKQWIALRANSVEPAEGEDWTELVGKQYVDGVSGVGSYVMVQEDLSGSAAPDSARYIKLEAGLTGIGDYNEGKLTNEAITGSAPLVEATAEIADPESPLFGQVVHLLETEERFLRAGQAGRVQNDQMQKIEGTAALNASDFSGGGAISRVASGSNRTTLGSGTAGSLNFNSANSDGARASATKDGETRAKNIGVSVYLRIK